MKINFNIDKLYKDKIYLLDDLGVEGSEIALILGISKVHVSKEKSLRKKNG